MSTRILTTADADAWNAALPAERSAFGSLGFARVQERSGAGEARLLVAGETAYPLLLRPLADLRLPIDLDAGRFDSASPPFTGPIGSPGVSAEATAEALREAGVVAEFAHLHPWKADPAAVGGAEADREIVWVDLTLDEESLWRNSYSKACRKNVNRAEREGVVVRPAAGIDDVAEFHRIYIGTMERNEAERSYFFDRAYFEAIYEEMADSARFVLAEHEGSVVAATLYLHDADDVYSYLGGADHAHQQLRPTNAVVHETIRWAREQGKKRLVLGGGYRPGDGIFRFKASFSPERATLELARRVHLPGDYEALVAAWRAAHGDPADEPSFFPLYRAEL
jgi:CelD/BcsL family acetyltransferase involved in cellulose biosynthesis